MVIQKNTKNKISKLFTLLLFMGVLFGGAVNVHAEDGYDKSSGPVWDFLLLNNPPYTPYNESPSDGATNRSLSTDLDWSGGDPDGDPVTYDVWFEADDPTPDLIVCNDTSSSSCSLPTLSVLTHYYWKVIADDGTDISGGPVWDFWTGDGINDPPTTPYNESPFDGATNRSINTDLAWSGGDPNGDPVTYDVYFEAGDSTPDSIICNDTSSSSCSLPTLAYNAHFYWKVIADDGIDTSGGPVWDFWTVSSPPSGGDTAGSYDPDTRIWRMKTGNTWDASVNYLQWGASGWIPVSGDWDNDIYDEVGFYDPVTKIWRMRTGNTWSDSVNYLVWGPNGGGWTPVTGDWDNDGYDEVGFYDPATGIWRMKTENTWSASVNYLQWGASGWKPVVGDWDNDGVDEAGHYDPVSGIWRLKTANTWNASVIYLKWKAQNTGWKPVIGDWDDDGIDEVGFYDPATGIWRLKTANTWNASVQYLQWGASGWTPVTGEW